MTQFFPVMSLRDGLGEVLRFFVQCSVCCAVLVDDDEQANREQHAAWHVRVEHTEGASA